MQPQRCTPCSHKGVHHAVTKVYTMQSQRCTPCSHKGVHHAVTKVYTMQSQKCTPCSHKGVHHAVTKVYTMRSQRCTPCGHRGVHHATTKVYSTPCNQHDHHYQQHQALFTMSVITSCKINCQTKHKIQKMPNCQAQIFIIRRL